MFSVILLTPVASCKFAEELERLGVRVWEALAVSEVLNLSENQAVDAVVILPDVPSKGISEIQKRFTCFVLDNQATPAELLWELTSLKQNIKTVQ